MLTCSCTDRHDHLFLQQMILYEEISVTSAQICLTLLSKDTRTIVITVRFYYKETRYKGHYSHCWPVIFSMRVEMRRKSKID